MSGDYVHNPVMVEAQVPYDRVSDDEFMALCRVLTKAAAARLFDLPDAEVNARYRAVSKVAKADRTETDLPEPMDNRSVLEILHEHCRAYVEGMPKPKDLLNKSRDVLIAEMKQIREVATTEKTIDAALEAYLQTTACMEALFEPLKLLSKSDRDKVLRSWSEKAEMRLMMRK
jgi:hypothetical protein